MKKIHVIFHDLHTYRPNWTKIPKIKNCLLTLEKEFQHQFGKFLPLSDRQSKVRSDDCLKRRQLVKNHDQWFKYYYLK